jgi:hypothetical protein
LLLGALASPPYSDPMVVTKRERRRVGEWLRDERCDAVFAEDVSCRA